MKESMKFLMHGAVLAAALTFSVTGLPAQAPAPSAKKTSAPKEKAAVTAAPTEKEIADAKAKGLVWVNTNSKAYHKDGEFYGKTKHGKFMTEADAQKEGDHLAGTPAGSKKKAVPAKK